MLPQTHDRRRSGNGKRGAALRCAWKIILTKYGKKDCGHTAGSRARQIAARGYSETDRSARQVKVRVHGAAAGTIFGFRGIPRCTEIIYFVMVHGWMGWR